MNNIVNIIKFDIKSRKVSLIIELISILFFIIQFSIVLKWIPSDGGVIPLISIILVLVISFILSTVNFIKSISNSEGRLLFLTSISGSELIIAKYLEFIGEGIISTILVCVGTVISRGDGKLVFITGISILFGLLEVFVLITSLVPILKSYFRNIGMLIFLTIISISAFSIISFILQVVAYVLLPHIYIIIGEIFEINIVNIFINVALLGGLICLSKYHIDNKLDIV